MPIQRRVIVVGSVNVDLVARAERLPAPGETVTGAAFSRHHGGKGGNQAVAAARLGAQTTFIGAIGDDEFGREARAALEAEGIDLSGLVVIPGATGVALILVGAGGENLISVASGANAELTADHVGRGLRPLRLAPQDVLLVGHEISTAAARSALVAGRAAGATTILDPAPVAGIDRSVFGLADIVTPNRGELAALVAGEAERVGRPWSGTVRPEVAARTLLDRSSEGEGVRRAVVVTLGVAGAVVVAQGQQPLDLPAPAIAAIDAVGAGDAFNGALAAGLADGLELAAAARRAIAAAALATTRNGAREGMPGPAEVDALLAAS
ncbi:MAG TPA: ribokinase [Candidatus Limnocylindrales bacterium]|nr:ribokinase [Candidatus Limnocylindrales bacterium]